ncbi:hypothetical protein ACIBF1_06850 [Spirillospora sp. NPDC050679]
MSVRDVLHWLAFLAVVGLAVTALVTWEQLRTAALVSALPILAASVAGNVADRIAAKRRERAAAAEWEEEDLLDEESESWRWDLLTRECRCDGSGQAIWCPACAVEHDAYGISVGVVTVDGMEPAMILLDDDEELSVDEARLWAGSGATLTHLYVLTDDEREWLLTRQTALNGDPADTRWWLLDWRDRSRSVTSGSPGSSLEDADAGQRP